MIYLCTLLVFISQKEKMSKCVICDKRIRIVGIMKECISHRNHFCWNCLKQWFSKPGTPSTCPLCKISVSILKPVKHNHDNTELEDPIDLKLLKEKDYEYEICEYFTSISNNSYQ